ncbi:MAG: HD domain-containing protein [Lachnospiraceae bacterium]|nr:HD domain-containing protein [Lachnospiraceae bacterium]
MIVWYYNVLLIIAFLVTVAYSIAWRHRYDVHLTLVFVVSCIMEIGYALLAWSKDIGAAVVATKVVFLGGCFLAPFMLIAVLNLCKMKTLKFVRVGLYALSTVVYVGALSIGECGIFYKSFSFETVGGAGRLTDKVYGPLHPWYYIMLLGETMAIIVVLVYCYFRKRNVTRWNLVMFAVPEIVSVFAFFSSRAIDSAYETFPLSVVMGLVIYLIIAFRLSLYDVVGNVLVSVAENGQTGVAAFDTKFRFLGSNETAKDVFPGLPKLRIDGTANEIDDESCRVMIGFVNDFAKDPSKDTAVYETGGRYYNIMISNLMDGKRKVGYYLLMTDDTENRKYIALLDNYNNDLLNEVKSKTENLVNIHNRLIMGMATMVESRDNSTGGHIMRTSTVVKILTAEMKRDNVLNKPYSFYENLVKAAPMHDLGKVAVDDVILRKPGKFTDEEFAMMKMHAAEGARIIDKILDGTDDEEFRKIATNVAHYHHERWDGSGYPEGLKGEEIPIEARIMAIADVYDALVSKRVYKERMSFEQADRIILEGMGNQFDSSLKPYYVAVRPRLEAYYSSLAEY